MNGLVANYIRDITNALGKSYEIYLNSIGDANVPGTALFEIDNLRLLAANNAPKFAVIDTNPAAFTIVPDNTNYLLNLAPGTISFRSALQIMGSNYVPFKQALSNLNTSYNYYYGGNLFIVFDDFLKAQNVYNIVVSQAGQVGDVVININDVTSLSGLSLPLNAQIQNTLYQVTYVDFKNSKITINNGLQNALLINDKIAITFNPKVNTIMGVPIKQIPSFVYNTINDFTYFPISPMGALNIGQFVIKVSSVSSVWQYTVLFFQNTYMSFPDPTSYASIFANNLNAISFANDANNALNTLKKPDFLSKNYNVLQGLIQYTQSLANNASTSFPEYWASQPFTPTTYFNLGNGFGNLERFDFDPYFIKYYYSVFNIDLVHTFAIFRGDIYNSGTVSSLNVTNLSSRFDNDLSSVSSLNKGTYTYGVTAIIRNSNIVGETNLQTTVIDSNNTSYNYLDNSLTWDAPVGTTPDFYNVYRQSNLVGDIFLSKLTSAYQIQYAPSIPQAIKNLQLSTSNFKMNYPYMAFKVISNNTTNFTSGGIVLQMKRPDSKSLSIASVTVNQGGSNYTAPTINATGAGQNASLQANIINGSIASVSIISGGDTFTSVPTLIVNDTTGSGASLTAILSSVQILLVEMNAGSALSLTSNSALYTSSPIYLKDLPSTVSTSMAFTFNVPVINFLQGKDYWIVIKQNFANNVLPVSASQILDYYNRTTAYPALTSSNGVNWSAFTPSGQPTTTTSSQTTSNTTTSITTIPQSTGQAEIYFALLGFMDVGLTGTDLYSKGVKLTGDTANVAKRLSIYIPPFDSSVYSVFKLNQSDNLAISNSMTVTVVARNGENGIPITLTGNVNKGATRGTRIALGTANQTFDRVDNVIVNPNLSAGVTYGADNLIKWSIKDFITVETIP